MGGPVFFLYSMFGADSVEPSAFEVYNCRLFLKIKLGL